jgi:cobalamin biosynthesis Mg chelatase CobN
MADTEIYGELNNLRRELDYYVVYEPENEKAMSKIEKKIEKLHLLLSKLTKKAK